MAEIIVQTLWEGAGDLAYQRWGWIGAIGVLLTPFVIIGIILWIVFG